MNDTDVKTEVESFLRERHVGFVASTFSLTHVGCGRVEVSYAVPETLIPGAVVDPPDIRVSIDLQTGLIEWITQM